MSSECAPAFWYSLSVTQIASLLEYILLSSVVCLALTYFFFKLSHKRQNFKEKKSSIYCVLIFSAGFISEISRILRIIRHHIMMNVDVSWIKVSVILVRFSQNLYFNFLSIWVTVKLAKKSSFSGLIYLKTKHTHQTLGGRIDKDNNIKSYGESSLENAGECVAAAELYTEYVLSSK